MEISIVWLSTRRLWGWVRVDAFWDVMLVMDGTLPLSYFLIPTWQEFGIICLECSINPFVAFQCDGGIDVMCVCWFGMISFLPWRHVTMGSLTLRFAFLESSITLRSVNQNIIVNNNLKPNIGDVLYQDFRSKFLTRQKRTTVPDLETQLREKTWILCGRFQMPSFLSRYHRSFLLLNRILCWTILTFTLSTDCPSASEFDHFAI